MQNEKSLPEAKFFRKVNSKVHFLIINPQKFYLNFLKRHFRRGIFGPKAPKFWSLIAKLMEGQVQGYTTNIERPAPTPSPLNLSLRGFACNFSLAEGGHMQTCNGKGSRKIATPRVEPGHVFLLAHRVRQAVVEQQTAINVFFTSPCFARMCVQSQGSLKRKIFGFFLFVRYLSLSLKIFPCSFRVRFRYVPVPLLVLSESIPGPLQVRTGTTSRPSGVFQVSQGATVFAQVRYGTFPSPLWVNLSSVFGLFRVHPGPSRPPRSI